MVIFGQSTKLQFTEKGQFLSRRLLQHHWAMAIDCAAIEALCGNATPLLEGRYGKHPIDEK
jgi:hypothetical protein